MIGLHRACLLLLFGFLACGSLQAATRLPATPAAQPQITQGISANVSAALPGNTRPEVADPANDRGPVADDFPLPGLLLQLRRTPAREAALTALIEAQQDPTS